MSDDIVARLRAFYTSTTVREAADEIERLREDVSDLEKRLEGDHGELELCESKLRTAEQDNEDLRIGADNLQAEIERLRAQLREYTGDRHTIGRDAECTPNTQS